MKDIKGIVVNRTNGVFYMAIMSEMLNRLNMQVFLCSLGLRHNFRMYLMATKRLSSPYLS